MIPLPEDRPALGLFVKSPDPEGARIAAAAGADFAVIDLEHSTLDLGEAAALVGVLADGGVSPLVRLAAPDAATIGKMLECGAAGVQLSSTSTAEQVGAVNGAVRFPPEGKRGLSYAHRRARWGIEAAGYPGSRDAAVVVVQIESALTVDPLEAILEAGADAVFIGVEDLRMDCASAGVDFEERFAEITEVARGSGLPWGCPAAPRALGRHVRAGGRFFTLGADRSTYAAALHASFVRARS